MHERRSATRYSLIQRCFAKPAAAPGAEGWRCIVYNISVAGVGITLPLPLKNGAVIWIEPWNLPGRSARQPGAAGGRRARAGQKAGV